jgi:hypothetical protein
MKKNFGIVILALLFIGMVISPGMMPAALAASQVSINNAIEKGLAFLNRTQNPDGSWSNFPVATTAMAVLAFENAPNSHYGWNASDPYNNTVQNGLNWLFSKAYVVSISGNKSAGNPDTNGNGIGIAWYGDGQSVYETPMVLMAIIASNAQTNVTTTGPANVTGRTYLDIIRDIVDWIAWAQNSVAANGQFEGGWRYNPQSGDSDNSVSQWPVLGLKAAQLWGINAPAWVQSELLKWTATMQNLSGNYSTNPYYGAFDYQLTGVNHNINTPAETSAGILELTYCGVNDTDSRIVAAEGYLNRDWNPNGSSPWGFGWNRNIGDLYAMYSVMKACRLTTPIPIQFIANYTGTPGVEWYNGTGEYADALVTNQSSDGRWNNWVSTAEDYPTELNSAWGVLILEYVPVKVTYKLTVHVVDANTNSSISAATVVGIGPENLIGVTDGTVVFNETQAGTYNVTASKTGYASASVSVSLTKDTETTIRLRPLTYKLTVHVVDANTSSSISAATVIAVGPQNLSGVTDGGTVVFDSTQTGSYGVTVSKTNYTSESASVNLIENTEITIRLTPSTNELVFSDIQTWIILIMVGLAAILGMGGVATLLVADADRIRRKRKEKGKT